MPGPIIQSYPRIEDSNYLDDSKLAPHILEISQETLEELIIRAIKKANQKSGRKILNIPEDATQENINKIYKEAGKKLFDYFRKYTSDPASSALKIYKKNCRNVAHQQYHINMLQKERMNSGWRYQYLATGCAEETGRFSISDLGLKEADFNASVNISGTRKVLSIYVSVKNRSNTIGGPDWPAAIEKLENYAITDRNRVGSYICVFAFVMDRGLRSIKRTKEGTYRSTNTELWSSDFFWPFFTTFKYEEIMQAVVRTLMSDPNLEEEDIDIPNEIIDIFEEYCRDYDLIDEDGNFNDPTNLVSFFCGSNKPKVKKTSRPKAIKSRKTKQSSPDIQMDSLFLPDTPEL